jgi:DNA polymerase III epsilon subunit-like protein
MVHLKEEYYDRINRVMKPYLRDMKSNIHIVFDFETNGIERKDDVLSVSAQKIWINKDRHIEVIGYYNRYYYCPVRYNPDATRINGLHDDSVITERRKKEIPLDYYPKYFKDDKKALLEFIGDCSNFIGHNHLSFDSMWLPECKQHNNFDTMIKNNWMPEPYNTYRGPKLVKAVDFYGIETDETQLHQSSYDVEMTKAVFEKMLNLSTIRMKKFE